jgi:hypothetical protein
MVAQQEMKLSTREDCNSMRMAREAEHLCDLTPFAHAAVRKSCEAPVYGTKAFAAREIA